MKYFFSILLLVACGKDDKQSIFTSQELLSYKSEQAIQKFSPKAVTNNELDILLVIDNSGSMGESQEELSKNLKPLLQFIGDSDWQIAITSSDTRDGIVKIITEKNKEKFASTIMGLKTDGIGNEAVLYQAIQALKGNNLPNDDLGLQKTRKHESLMECIDHPNNISNCPASPWGYPSDCPCFAKEHSLTTMRCEKRKPWLRDKSMLAILLVTDEDHQCHNRIYGCTINDFYFYLKSIREPHATVKVYGLLDDSNGRSNGRSNGGIIAGNRRFTEWRDSTGTEGLFESWSPIGDTKKYNETLKKISQSIASAIKTNFTLDYAYDNKGELEVTITAGGNSRKLKKGEYRISGKTLTIISKLPNNVEEIEVRYSHGK